MICNLADALVVIDEQSKTISDLRKLVEKYNNIECPDCGSTDIEITEAACNICELGYFYP